MAQILAYQIFAQKAPSGSGNVILQFIHPSGNLAFCCAIPAADFTSINTTVNGGAAGTSLTVPAAPPYAQNLNQSDYPVGYGVSL